MNRALRDDSASGQLRELLAEARAWRELATMIDGSRWTTDYICWHLPVAFRSHWHLYAKVSVSAAVAERMDAKIRAFVAPGDAALSASFDDEAWDANHKSVRVLFCLFLALEAADEAAASSPRTKKGALNG